MSELHDKKCFPWPSLWTPSTKDLPILSSLSSTAEKNKTKQNHLTWTAFWRLVENQKLWVGWFSVTEWRFRRCWKELPSATEQRICGAWPKSLLLNRGKELLCLGDHYICVKDWKTLIWVCLWSPGRDPEDNGPLVISGALRRACLFPVDVRHALIS